jgi:hypothetical protein
VCLVPSARWNEVVMCKWRDVNWSCGELRSDKHRYCISSSLVCPVIGNMAAGGVEDTEIKWSPTINCSPTFSGFTETWCASKPVFIISINRTISLYKATQYKSNMLSSSSSSTTRVFPKMRTASHRKLTSTCVTCIQSSVTRCVPTVHCAPRFQRLFLATAQTLPHVPQNFIASIILLSKASHSYRMCFGKLFWIYWWAG